MTTSSFLLEPSTVLERTAWCSKSAPRPTSSPSSCGTGVALALMTSPAPSISNTELRISNGIAPQTGRRPISSTERAPSQKATAGVKNQRDCTSVSSSRHAVTGSPTSQIKTHGGVNVLNLVQETRPSWKAPRIASLLRSPLCRLHHSWQ